jgi:hypothetical protein
MKVVRSRIRTRLDGEHRVRSETCPNEERRIVESLDSTVCHDSNLPFGENPRLSYSGHRRWRRCRDIPLACLRKRERYNCSITVPSARVRDSIQRRPDRDRPAVARARTEDDPSERGIGMTMNRCTDPAAKVLAELRPRPSGPTGRCVSDTQRLEAMGASP